MPPSTNSPRCMGRSRARLFPLLAFASILVPLLTGVAHAIQLKWSSGAKDLSFVSDTLSRLVVEADSAEVTLPGHWRLLWTADSSGVKIVSVDSLLACQTDTAKVSTIDPPSTAADSAANQVTAHFCSAGSDSASIAYFLLDLVGGSKGKLEVVALNPTDTTQVIESNEVTYNGGVTGDYSPTVLSFSVSHEGSPLTIMATGTSLGSVTSATVLTPDTTWTIPLTIQARTDTSITATGTMTQALQGSSLFLASATGSTGLSPLPDDEIFERNNARHRYVQYEGWRLAAPQSAHLHGRQRRLDRQGLPAAVPGPLRVTQSGRRRSDHGVRRHGCGHTCHGRGPRQEPYRIERLGGCGPLRRNGLHSFARTKG